MIKCPCCAKNKLARVSSRLIDIDGKGVLICHDCFLEDVYKNPENKKKLIDFINKEIQKETLPLDK